MPRVMSPSMTAAHLLCLAEGEALHADVEQAGLYALPLPALLLPAAVELDVLHPRDELHDAALVGRSLLEPHVVQLAPAPEEDQHPPDVEGAAEEEDA